MFAEALLASLLAANSTCVDMRQLYNDYVINECVNYYSVPANIEQKKLDKKLSAMFRAFTANQTNKLYLLQAQLSDSELLEKGIGAVKPSDPFATILAPGYFTGPYTVGETNKNFLAYFTDFARKSGLQLILSLGGPAAKSSDMKISPNTAQQLKTFMKKHNISGVDLDLRGEALKGILEQNDMQTIISFIKHMPNTTLTTDGNLNEGPKGKLQPLFARFSDLFTGLNLMLFSEKKHRLGKNDSVYGLQQWKNFVKPNQIHLGFNTKIEYKNPGSNEGTSFVLINGLNNGQTAAHIINKFKNHFGLNFGEPVFFTDNSLQLESNKFIQEFEAYLSK